MEIDSNELRKILYRLFSNDEDECVEFKEAKNIEKIKIEAENQFKELDKFIWGE